MRYVTGVGTSAVRLACSQDVSNFGMRPMRHALELKTCFRHPNHPTESPALIEQQSVMISGCNGGMKEGEGGARSN